MNKRFTPKFWRHATLALSLMAGVAALSPASAAPDAVSLRVNQNPIQVCDGSSLAKATLSWSGVKSGTQVKVTLGSAQGQSLYMGYGSNSFTTEKILRDGDTIHLLTKARRTSNFQTAVTVKINISSNGCASTATSQTVNCDNAGLPFVSASASRNISGHEPAKAIDNSLGTSWNSGDFPTQWISADLGSVYTLTDLCLHVNMLVGTQPSGNARHEIQTSFDGTNWRTSAVVDKLLFSNTWEKVNLNNVAARYVRINTVRSGSWVAWTEIKAFGKPGGSAPTPPPPATDPDPFPVPSITPSISGYGINSNCFARTDSSVSAVSNEAGSIRFELLTSENTVLPNNLYTGPTLIPLSPQLDGSYAATVPVSTHDLPEGTAVIFRLYNSEGQQISPGFGAVSHDYDSHCTETNQHPGYGLPVVIR